MHNKDMKKDAVITVRLPVELKRQLAARARRERRSLSAQVEHELAHVLGGVPTAAGDRSLAADRATPRAAQPRPAAPLLGRYEGAAVPSDQDIRDVRAMLWGSLGRRGA